MLSAAFASALVFVVSAGSAGAFIYWPTGYGQGVGRSSVNGTGVDGTAYSELGAWACSVVVHGKYLYYGGEDMPDVIGRVPLAGGKPDPGWLQGASRPCALAVYGNYIYWVNEQPSYSGATGSIGRASLTGRLNVHQDFITDVGISKAVNNPCGLTVNADGIYWTNQADGSVGHANLDGSSVTTLVTAADAGCSITQSGSNLYWTTNGQAALSPDGDTIARSGLDGSAVDLTWGTNLNGPCGLASFSHYLYFGANGGVIDRIDLDSQSLQSSETQIVQVPETGGVCAVAVDSLFLGKVSAARARPRNHGSVLVSLSVSDPGRVSVRAASGKQVPLAPASVRAHHAGRLSISLRPTAFARRELRHTRQLLTELTISFTPTGGIANPVTLDTHLTR